MFWLHKEPIVRKCSDKNSLAKIFELDNQIFPMDSSFKYLKASLNLYT